jgi:hypothetical protein
MSFAGVAVCAAQMYRQTVDRQAVRSAATVRSTWPTHARVPAGER